MSADEERIALFLDYENLAIGARENLGGMVFDFKPVADALAERGRVVVRRAYADWLKFGEDGRMLTRFHVELIEIPQRMGSVRKNAADIKMAVDAVELCLERDYITTFVLGTGDSDFTPLVHKLREHNKQVIGLGVQMSTSALLPPACDEFLFYERLEGVEVPKRRIIVPRGPGGRRRRPQVGDVGVGVEVEPEADTDAEATAAEAEAEAPATMEQVERLVTQTLAGLDRSGGAVRASSLKRAILRKESTFSEADHGFRGFTEFLRSLAERGVIELVDSSSPGDPDVQFPSDGNLGEVGHAFELLAGVVERLAPAPSPGTPLSGLKTQMRRQQTDFSEKRFGFGGFLQFAKAAVTRGVVAMAWDDDADDYLLTPVPGRPTFETGPAAAPTGTTGAEAAGTETAEAAPGEEGGSPSRSRRGRGGRGRGRGRGAESDVAADTEAADTETGAPGEATEAVEPSEVLAEEDAPATAPEAEPVEPEAVAELDAEPEAAAVTEPVVAPGEPVEATEAATAPGEAEPAEQAEPPKRRRRTTSKKAAEAAEQAEPVVAATEQAAGADAAPAKPAPRRRRSTKAAADTADQPAAAAGDGPAGDPAP